MTEVAVLLSILLPPIVALLFFGWAARTRRLPLAESTTAVDSARVSLRRDRELNFTNGRIWLAESGLVFVPQNFSLATPLQSEISIPFDEILSCEVGSPEVLALFQGPLKIETAHRTWRIYFAAFQDAWSLGRKAKWRETIRKRMKAAG